MPHFIIFGTAVVALFIGQLSWTYAWTLTYNAKIERVLVNQTRIIEQFDAIITQDKAINDALGVLARNDQDIVDKCVKALEQHVHDTGRLH